MMARELTPDQWARAKTVFADLADINNIERQPTLEQVDPDLRPEVERLLSNHETAKRKGRLLDKPGTSLSLLLDAMEDAGVFEPRQVLLDRFEIVRLIGRGGMGEVYEALDTERAALVAIKTVRFNFLQDDSILDRFRAEASRSRLVSHPNICGAYELFCLDQGGRGIPFFSMELLRGETLYERIRNGGAMAGHDALCVARQICSGLGAAHRAGLVHADLKSSNVIFVSTEEAFLVKITDFGLARELPSDGDSVITGSVEEGVSGTLAYMAPELLEGRRPTAASDIYALGVLLYRMVTGRYPFEAKADLVSAAMRMRHPAPSPRSHVPQLSSAWERCIIACLAADVWLRPTSAEVVARLLEDVPSAKWSHRSRVTLHQLSRRSVIGTGAIVVVGTLASGLWVWLHRPPFADRVAAVLVEDFDSPDPGAALGRAVRNMVKLTWFGSSQLQVVKPDVLNKAARVLGLGALPIRGDVALKLAREARADIIVSGSITPQGSEYRIRFDVIHVRDTEKIVSAEGSAGDYGSIAPVTERLCGVLYTALAGPARAGSPATIRIEPANTVLPDALESFTSGLAFLQYGDIDVALNHFRAATRLDSEFAIAYIYQAIAHGTLRHDEQAFEAASRGFALKDRLQDRQRIHAEATYHYFCGDITRALDAQRLLATTWPDEAQLHRHVAQTYASMDLIDEAVRHGRIAVELDRRGATNYMVLSAALVQAGKLPDARQLLTHAHMQIGDSPALVSSDATLRMIEGDVSGALAALDGLARYRGYASHANALRIRCLLIYGRLDEARIRLENDMTLNQVTADTAHEDLSRWWLAQLLNLANDQEQSALNAAELASRPAQPYSLFALRAAAQVASDANAPAVIASVMQKLKTIVSAYPSTRATSFALQAEGLREQSLGNMTRATTLLTRAHEFWPDIANAFRLAQAHIAIRSFSSALPLLESVLARKGAAIRWEQQIAWVLSHAAAAECCRALRQNEAARTHQAEFMRYWGTETGLPRIRALLAKETEMQALN